jgi:chromate transporter
MTLPRAVDASVSLRALLALFLKIGLSFGAGTGMSAVLQDELVRKRRAMGRGEFMALYGLARLVPSGSMTALAVAIGYRYQRWLGTVVVLLAMIAPGFSLMVVLTVGYTLLFGSPVMRVLSLTLMPAAVALVVVSTFRLGSEFFTFERRAFLRSGRTLLVPSVELGLLVAAFVAVLAFGMNPAFVLVAGGVVGALVIRDTAAENAE